MEIIIEAGDRIQARKVVVTDDDRPDQIIPVEFDTTGVSGEAPARIVQGCALGDLAENDGWTFDLIRKAVLHLPAGLSEIDAILLSHMSSPILLTGKGDVWRNTRGVQIDPSLILAWEAHEG